MYKNIYFWNAFVVLVSVQHTYNIFLFGASYLNYGFGQNIHKHSLTLSPTLLATKKLKISREQPSGTFVSQVEKKGIMR